MKLKDRAVIQRLNKYNGYLELRNTKWITAFGYYDLKILSIKMVHQESINTQPI